MKFVPSAENKADFLTRVPKKWLCLETEPVACAAATILSEQDIVKVHETTGHFVFLQESLSNCSEVAVAESCPCLSRVPVH